MLQLVLLISVIGFATPQLLQAGDSCIVEVDGSSGICTYVSYCSIVSAWAQVLLKPGICSYDDLTPIICCPVNHARPQIAGTGVRTTISPAYETEIPFVFPNDRPFESTPRPTFSNTNPPQEYYPDERISLTKCREYSQQVTKVIGAIPLVTNPDPVRVTTPKCNTNGLGLIVGGTKAEAGEFPHMAAIGYRISNKIEWNCGGTLISHTFVVTAAHCVNTQDGQPTRIRLGELNLESDQDGSRPVDFDIRNIHIHPRYVPPAKYNDIALIQLNRRANFNEFIRPACLWNQRGINFTKAIATGWGQTSFISDPSPHLRKVSLDLIENRYCQNYYPIDDRILPSGVSSTMLCALTPKKDTCFGDSGGPLTVVTEGNYCIFYIVGVTSFGKSCAGASSPGVYTRISSYIDWIESIVWT